MTTETKTEARERMDDEDWAKLERMDVTHPMLKERAGLLFYEEADRARKAEASLTAALSALRAEHQRVSKDAEWFKRQRDDALALVDSKERVIAELTKERDEARAKLGKIDHQHEMCPCGGLKWTSCRICAHTADCRGCPDCQQAVARPWVRPEEHDKVIAERDAEMRSASYARSLLAEARAALAASEEKARRLEEALEAESRFVDAVVEHNATVAEEDIDIVGYLLNDKVQPLRDEADRLRIAALSSPSAGPARCSAAFDGFQCELETGHTSHHRHSHGPTVGGGVEWDDAPSAGPASEAKLPEQTWPRVYIDPAKWMEIAKCKHCPHPERCAESNACTCSAACPHGASPAPRVGAETEACRCGQRRCFFWPPSSEPRPPGPPAPVHTLRTGMGCPACKSVCAHGPASEEPKR